jgi:hypothetical protein
MTWDQEWERALEAATSDASARWNVGEDQPVQHSSGKRATLCVDFETPECSRELGAKLQA